MNIGNTPFNLKNMSRNQRMMYKAIKEKYDQAIAEGFDPKDEWYGRLELKNGKVTKEDLEFIMKSTPSDFYGYTPVSKMKDVDDEDAELYRIHVEEFIRRVTPVYRTGRKGKRRQISKGQQVAEDVVNKLRMAVDLYRYKKVSIAIDMIPLDIKEKIFSTDPMIRYEGYYELNQFLQTLDFKSINVKLDGNYDEVEDVEGDEG